MINGLMQRRFDMIGEAAHSLKSSSAMLGAMALSTYCTALETDMRASRWENAKRLVSQVVAEYATVYAMLAKLNIRTK
jgi:HPt (histidine-containing phosphotransfer) domain-containing protein